MGSNVPVARAQSATTATPVRLVVPGISWTLGRTRCACVSAATRCFSRFGKKCGPKLQPVNPRPRVAATPPLGPVRRHSRMGTTPSTQPGFPAFRKRSQEQRPPLVVYQEPRKTLCLSTGGQSGLASLEQAFLIWQYLNSTETPEEDLGAP